MASTQLAKRIREGGYDNTFQALYGKGTQTIERQRSRYLEAISEFEAMYGEGRNITLYSTPGRTEIGGNHTDHNNGVVLAAAVNLDIIAVVSVNNENFIRLQSKGFAHPDVVDITHLSPVEAEKGGSASLVRGVAHGICELGGKIGGFDAYTTSDVLRGSGLSSSAAFEVCVATILNGEYNNGKFTAVELAQISQKAENNFFGKPSGLMDQTACSVGGAVSIDFKTPEKPVVNAIPFNLEAFGYKLVITDTKGSHADLTHEYAAIRDEMQKVANCFGKDVLREVDWNEFYQSIPQIRSKTGDRAILRAIHFFEECRRAKMLAQAVQQLNFEEFLALIIESGHSSFEYNQNAFSAQNPQEQGVSLGLAISQLVLSGKGAWRLQGGGFGGTIQAFVPNALVDTYCKALENVFGEKSCYVLSVRGYGGVKVTESLG